MMKWRVQERTKQAKEANENENERLLPQSIELILHLLQVSSPIRRGSSFLRVGRLVALRDSSRATVGGRRVEELLDEQTVGGQFTNLFEGTEMTQVLTDFNFASLSSSSADPDRPPVPIIEAGRESIEIDEGRE
jgi:hypothetical protein